MNKKLIYLALIFSFLLMPYAYALEFDSVVDVIGSFGEFIQDVFNSSSARVFVFFILLFIVVYAALDVALSKVKVFEGKDRQRKMFAVGMGFLTDLAFFLATNPSEFVERIITFAGPFGGIIIGMIAFLAVYRTLDLPELSTPLPRALMALGIGLIVAGMLMGSDYDVLVTIGVLTFIGGLIWLITELVGKGGSTTNNRTNNPGDPDSTQDGGPSRIKYNKPNVVKGFELKTSYLKQNGRIDRKKARATVLFNLDQGIWDNERIQNLEVRLTSSRFIKGGAIFNFLNRNGNFHETIFPFPRPRQFTNNIDPFELPKDVDFGKEISIQVRAINNAGKGRWSKAARLVIGSNPIEEIIEVELGNEYEINPSSIHWGNADRDLTGTIADYTDQHPDIVGRFIEEVKAGTKKSAFLSIKFLAPPLHKFVNDNHNLLDIHNTPISLPNTLTLFLGPTPNFKEKLAAIPSVIPLKKSSISSYSSNEEKVGIVMFIQKGSKGLIKRSLEDPRTKVNIKMRCTR